MRSVERSLFIFRRDLRLEDNSALLAALKASKTVILAFIFTPEQLENNHYKSDRCLQFMIESLEDLEAEIIKRGGKLYLFYDAPERVVEKLIREHNIDAVFVNQDYTPYSIQRDKKIEQVCEKYSKLFYSFEDLLLHTLKEEVKGDGNPYTIFTPFYNNASKLIVQRPEHNSFKNFYSGSISFSRNKDLYQQILPARKIQQKGGRKEALKILKEIGSYQAYEYERDFPALNKTTHLSPHLKFTTCSIREVYCAISEHFSKGSGLIRSLYWRDFFSVISYFFPHVFKGAFKPHFDHLEWSEDQELFQKWCEGQTGFPIVDAGMRELNETGFMHNRVRMITASFLVKDLHINWQWGEKYFAQHLIDYDPAVNNGNWQWAASTGCDAQPYFRIFNPWIQAKKFDPDCSYIKKWIPELQDIPSKAIHAWNLEKNYSLTKHYPKPVIEHSEESKISLKMYKSVVK